MYTKEQAEAEFPEYSTDFKGAEPGQIVAVLPHTFFIGCGKDLLKVNEVQAEGKKRMTSDAYVEAVWKKEWNSENNLDCGLEESMNRPYI